MYRVGASAQLRHEVTAAIKHVHNCFSYGSRLEMREFNVPLAVYLEWQRLGMGYVNNLDVRENRSLLPWNTKKKM